MSEPLIAAIVLAAGSSTRFGPENKLLADAGGKSVIESVFANVTECGFDVVVVVIAPNQPEISTLARTAGFTSVVNPDSASGMGTSIACGIKQLLHQTTESLSGVAVFLGDMPSINRDISRQLIAKFNQSGHRSIVRPVNQLKQKTTPGHPVIFPSDLFPDLQLLKGDTGAKQLIAENWQRLTEQTVTDIGATADIDYLSDLSNHTNN